MKPVLLFFDEQMFEERIAKIEPVLVPLNQILSAYNTMKFAPLTDSEFRHLIINPESVVFDKMNKEQPLTIGGFQVDKTKAMDILIKPDGYNEMINEIHLFKKSDQHWQHHLHKVDIIDGVVAISEDVVSKEKEASKIYAENEAQLKAFNFAKSIVDLAKNLWGDGYFKHMGMAVDKLIETTATRQYYSKDSNKIIFDNGRYIIKYKAVKEPIFGSENL
jgi:hypothetical protein